MNGKIITTSDNRREFTIYLDDPASFKLGAEVTVNLKKRLRTLKQNALWWVFMAWLLSPHGGDLIHHGYYAEEAIHENTKGWFEATYPSEFKINDKFTTTTLDSEQWGRFLELSNQEFFVEELHVDTSGFFKDYERYTTWQTTNPGGMKEYLKERLPF
jgi:hypothetical protein